MSEQEKIQSAKQELNQYYDLLRKGQNLKSNLEELRTRMQAIKVFAGGERVSGGQKQTDRLEIYIDKCAALEHEIAATIWEMSERQNEIEQKINRLSGMFADILHKRYIERKSFEKIAVECNYSYRQVKRLHHRALFAYCEKMSPNVP